MFATIFPILLAFFIPTLVFLCYFQGHVNYHFGAFLPLVSDTANYVPEAAIFTFLINLIGFLFVVVAYIRFLQIKAILNSRSMGDVFGLSGEPQEKMKQFISQLNFWSVLSGFIVALSCCATGAFRFGETFVLHGLSASGIFAITPVYVGVQTFLSSKLSYRVANRKVIRSRYIVAAFMYISVVVFVVSLPISAIGYTRDFTDPFQRVFWDYDHGGFVAHVINAAAEWAFLLSISPYILTFAYDFRRITFRGLQIDYHFIY